MATESEVLLKAAAKIAAHETGAAGKQQDVVATCIQVTLRGSRSFIFDVLLGKVTEVGVKSDGEDERAVAAAVSRARLHLTYASEDVFLELAHK